MICMIRYRCGCIPLGYIFFRKRGCENEMQLGNTEVERPPGLFYVLYSFGGPILLGFDSSISMSMDCAFLLILC